MNREKTFLHNEQYFRLTGGDFGRLMLEKHMQGGLERTLDVSGPWNLTGLFEIDDGSISFYSDDEILEYKEPLIAVYLPAWSLTEISGCFRNACLKMVIEPADGREHESEPRVFIPAGTSRTISRCSAPSSRARQIKAALEDHYRDDVNMKELACSFSMKESAFSLCFSRSWRLSPKQYQIRLRIHYSLMQMLSGDESKLKVIDTAFDAGFQDLSRFNKQFRAILDLRPREILGNKWQQGM